MLVSQHLFHSRHFHLIDWLLEKNVKLISAIEATGVRFVLLQVYVGVPRDEGAGEKEREDAIKAVDEACDESQQLRVRQETARIVRKYSFVPVCIFFDSENGSLHVSGKLPTYPSPKPAFCPKW